MNMKKWKDYLPKKKIFKALKEKKDSTGLLSGSGAVVVAVAYSMMTAFSVLHPTPVPLSTMSHSTEVSTYQYSPASKGIGSTYQYSPVSKGIGSTYQYSPVSKGVSKKPLSKQPYEIEDMIGLLNDTLETLAKEKLERRQRRQDCRE